MLFKVVVMLGLMFLTANAELPKSVQADMYLLKAKNNMENSDYKSAMKNFEKILELGVAVPNSFHYFYAKTLYENHMYQKVLDELDLFLNNGGSKSKHYVKALELYTKAESEVEKVKLEEQKREKERKAKMQKLREKQLALDKKYKKIYNEYLKERKVFYDKKTGLMWTRPMDHNYKNNPYIKKNYNLTLNEAKAYCKNLVLDGYSDWELPNMTDLTTVMRSNPNSIIKWKESKGGYPYYFWAIGESIFRLTSYKKNSRKCTNGKYYITDISNLDTNSKREVADALCVRIHNKNNHKNYFKRKTFTINKNGHKIMVEDSFFIDGIPYIYDVEVKLWQAKNYCNKLELDGFNDWRVPTKTDELKYLPCELTYFSRFIKGDNYLRFICNDEGVFGDSTCIVETSKCKVYSKPSYWHGLVRCVRDVDKPKEENDNTSDENPFGTDDDSF